MLNRKNRNQITFIIESVFSVVGAAVDALIAVSVKSTHNNKINI